MADPASGRYPRRLEVRKTFFDTWEVRADETRQQFVDGREADYVTGQLMDPRMVTDPDRHSQLKH